MPKSALKDVRSAMDNVSPRKTRVTVSSFPALQGTARWLGIMRQFTKAQKETCVAISSDITKMSKDEMTFPTGSKYKGTWNVLGISGQGRYKFPHRGTVYEGEFNDGQFHGDGELIYENGAVLAAKWNKGLITSRNLMFGNGLLYDEQDWKYCKHPDRRYTVEIDDVIEPSGRSHLVAEDPPRNIPPGMYDCGDGFFDPVTKTIYSYNDLNHIIRSTTEKEIQWTVANCRKSPDIAKGPCTFLYEEWMKPILKTEEPPPPSCRTNKNMAMEENSEVFDFGSRSTSRIHLESGKLQGCTRMNNYYVPGSNRKGHHSDQVLEGNVSKADKIGYDSLRTVVKRSNLTSKAKLIASKSKNFDIIMPASKTFSSSEDYLKNSEPTKKQLSNW